MSYLHINNLYKDQDILLFKECYAMEKIHGTSAHISWDGNKITNDALKFFAGGVSHEKFIALFDQVKLAVNFSNMFGVEKVIIFGEAYGEKCQGMSATYGKDLKFVVFDVMVGNLWLNVLNAEDVAYKIGLDFVPYIRISTDINIFNKLRDSRSEQSIKNGIMEWKKREGIVLRPLIELRKNNGERIIAKHKGEEFQETKIKREVSSGKVEILREAKKIADEWVTQMRLTHVLDKFPGADISKTGDVIKAMLEDIEREAKGEIEMSKEARKEIGAKTVKLFKQSLEINLLII